MKRILFELVILASIVGVGLFGYQEFLTPVESQGPAEDPSIEIVTVGRTTLEKTVSATGSIEPEAEVELKFETGGSAIDSADDAIHSNGNFT